MRNVLVVGLMERFVRGRATALSEPSRCGPQPYGSERESVPATATSAPSGEFHLHNLCQQVPNAPKNEGGREERREKTLTK